MPIEKAFAIHATPERIYAALDDELREAEAASDGLSHLTLITCAGTYIHGQFDHRTVVYATRSY